MDAADADVEHPHAVGQRLGQQRSRNGGTHPVVGPQHVAEAGDDSIHNERIGVVAPSEADVLTERLTRYPPDGYPVQHATTQFHLGSVLLQSGESEGARSALTAARDLFDACGMRLEQAKANVMLGVALRTTDQPDQAAATLSTARAALAELDQPAEEAAASYNLGLVLQDAGEPAAARVAWTLAGQLFLAAGYPAQAAASAREHGASLLAEGEVEAAVVLLAEATELADNAGDPAGAGAAANALGLAHLAAQQPADAITALRRALADFPRSVRPADNAMVKANLGLAYEQVGDGPRARLAARQALALGSAPAAVRAQAEQLLARRPGDASADLLNVVDAEPPDEWLGLLREEVLRAVEVPDRARRDIVRGFVDGLLTRPDTAYDLAETLLQAVLELPPRAYDLLASALAESCADRPGEDAARLHAVISSAMARFAIPQWQRLAATLNNAARAAGQPAAWT